MNNLRVPNKKSRTDIGIYKADSKKAAFLEDDEGDDFKVIKLQSKIFF